MSLFRENNRLLASAILVAAAIVAGGLWMTERNLSRAAGSIPAAATPDYGRHLLRDTARYLGPLHENAEMRYSGSHLACASCHLDIGTRPGTLSLLETAGQYPRESGRDGGVRDLRDRINGCMTRSMNGRELPRDSVEMIAMEQYILGLREQYGVMSEIRRAVHEPPAFREPDRAADPVAGEAVYAG
ncbi:MAG: hypothetical protein OEV41_13300, partial [Gammaproteobacteria bacterium]|nr:hypothetical protein [Gammaproteobacteria bacterium]